MFEKYVVVIVKKTCLKYKIMKKIIIIKKIFTDIIGSIFLP